MERTAPTVSSADRVSGTVVQVGTVRGSVTLPGEPRTPVPRQLPAPPRLFTDREAEFRSLEELLGEVAAGSGGRTAVLTGTGGVGKTALATRFLDQTSPAFPDGALYADLLGFTEEGPADPSDVLDAFLRALGADPATIPQEFSARAAAFRSHTHGRRIAVLLDNALSEAQVRALTPGQGAHLVIVTTRLRMPGLGLDGATLLDVRPLGQDAAVDLVSRMLGDDRARSEPASARQLVSLCGRLPLALRAAVSGLALRPHQPLSRLVTRLNGEKRRLAELSHDREQSVNTVLTTSYEPLPEPARRLYRLLGLAPGRDVTAEAAAALLDRDAAEAEDLLVELVTANLLEETTGGRFSQHDLVRLHARALAEAEEDESRTASTAALDRLLEYYLTTTAAADRALNPDRWHLAPVFDRAPERAFASREAALGWLESELEVLRATVRFCAATGRHATCWQLCEALFSFFVLRKHLLVWREVAQAGLASARSLGDPRAQARTLSIRAIQHLHAQEPDQARDLQRQALDLWRTVGHSLGEAASLEGLGVCELARGRPADARGHFESALAIHTRLGRNRGIALMLRRLGEVSRDLRDHSSAVVYFEGALDFFTETEEPYVRAVVLNGLAATHAAAAEPVRTRRVLEEVLRLSDRIGARAERAGALVVLADLAETGGRLDEARERLSEALTIYTELSSPLAARTRSRLDRPPYA
ncbi:tetratricopeptide repeat protein [Nocardiopsis sp. NPDC006938]|uniref:tetratricopeptide repeat protein n=1 Tax=Nocardiopsis sp. NPDC006938 TaxID=3364337 RepID=UPI00368D5B2F